jgi:phage baseplate assembly protein V
MDARALQRLFRPLQRRLQGLVARCVLALVDDTLARQGVQVTLGAGETQDVERVQDYGFTSVPEAGAEGIALAVGGSAGHRVVIALDDRRYRKTGMAAGEVAVYHKSGSYLHLMANGDLVIKAAHILIGEGAAEALVKGPAMQTLFNEHRHLGNLGAPTGVPLVPMDGSQLSANHKVE